MSFYIFQIHQHKPLTFISVPQDGLLRCSVEVASVRQMTIVFHLRCLSISVTQLQKHVSPLFLSLLNLLLSPLFLSPQPSSLPPLKTYHSHLCFSLLSTAGLVLNFLFLRKSSAHSYFQVRCLT